MRRVLTTAITMLAVGLVLAPNALAANDGQGLYGPTNDKVVTDAGFILIIGFPLLILFLSLLQSRLDKRKDAHKDAQKALQRIDSRGGW